MAKITMQRLKVAAEDLNTLYEKPAIKINAETTDNALIAAIEKCGEGLEDGDLLTQATVDLLIELEIDVPSKIKIKKEAKATKPAKADKPEKKAKAPKEKGALSKRMLIFNIYSAGEKNPEVIFKKMKEAVPLATIKLYVSAWNNGRQVPGGAK